MHFTCYTLFPEMFPGTLSYSIAGDALKKKLWSLDTVNIRDYARDKHQTVDDSPYGGGTGMVMRADVIGGALDANLTRDTKLLYMSPRGERLTQAMVQEFATCEDISIICGRYEGVDERVIEEYGAQEISVGDYVLSGGEVAALTLMDSCVRLIDGVIGKESAILEESFGFFEEYTGLLEYPLYTRPSIWKDRQVPDVLRSGDHEKIKKWRIEQAKEITKLRRPDLLDK